MNITIIGTGNIGSALGKRWDDLGHTITYGSRNPEGEKTLKLVAEAGEDARSAGITEAVIGADVVVLATPWDAIREVIRQACDLTGKIVVDCINPPEEAGLGQKTSAGEKIAAWIEGAHVVKTLNTTGADNILDPNYDGQQSTMFIAGNDADAKATVTELVQELGFEVVDAGDITASRYLESLAKLWTHLAYTVGKGPDIAFKLLTR